MKRLVLSLLALVSTCCGSALASAPMGDRIPKEAIFYAGWAGRSDVFRKSIADQLVMQPEAKQIMAAIQSAIVQHLQGQEQQQAAVEHAFAMAGIAWKHPMAVAVLEPNEGNPFRGVLLIDLGMDRAEFDKHLQAVLDMAALPLQEATTQEAAFPAPPQETQPADEEAPAREPASRPYVPPPPREITYRTFQPGPHAPVLSIGYMDNMLFVAAGTDVPAKVLALTGSIQAADYAIISNRDFTDAYAEVAGKDEVAVAYLNVPGLARLIKQSAHGRQEVDKVLAATGLSKVTTVVSSAQIVDQGWFTRTRVSSPAPHQGLLMLLAGGEPVKVDDFAGLPADSDLAMTMKVSPSAFLTELQRCLMVAEPKAGMAMGMALAMADKKLGLSLRDDLLSSIGDRWFLADAPSQGGFLTGAAWMVELKDAQKFNAGMAKVEQVVNHAAAPASMPATGSADYSAEAACELPRHVPAVEIRTMTAGSNTIKYALISSAPGIAPAWAVSGDKLVVALWPQVVQATLEGPRGETLNNDAAFKAAFAHLQGQPSVVSYENTPAIIRQVYGLPLIGWSAASNALRRTGVDLRQEWLPSLPAIEKYLWPSISGISSDDKGLLFESYSSLPVGGGGMIAANPALMASILLPSLSRARGLARESMTQANLKSIGTAIAMYEEDNKDRMPENLQVLVQEKRIAEQNLISPLSNKKAYVYLPQPGDVDPALILAYEDPATHGQKMTAVLFAGFNVKMMPVNQAFWDLVQKSKENSEKAFGEKEEKGEIAPLPAEDK